MVCLSISALEALKNLAKPHPICHHPDCLNQGHSIFQHLSEVRKDVSLVVKMRMQGSLVGSLASMSEIISCLSAP